MMQWHLGLFSASSAVARRRQLSLPLVSETTDDLAETGCPPEFPSAIGEWGLCTEQTVPSRWRYRTPETSQQEIEVGDTSH